MCVQKKQRRHDASPLFAESACYFIGAGQVPALSFTDTTSTSRSLRSWLATSTPVGGVPAVAPPVGAPVADFSAAFSLP